MARPTKTPDQARTRPLKFWATELEEQQLDELAASHGMNRSDFMRDRCLGAEPLHPKATPDMAALLKALGMLGFNRAELNQILKDRWKHKYVDPQRAEAALARIEECADLIHQALGHGY